MSRTSLSPEHLLEEWHPLKNDGYTLHNAPRSLKFWWIDAHGHEWEASIAKRRQGKGCPYCNGNKVLAGFNDLATRYPHLVSEWHPTLNGDVLPTHVSHGSKQKIWWICKKEHEWDMAINARTGSNQGCAYCSGKRILVGYNDLATMYPAVTAQWHPSKNSELTPYTVVGKSGKRAWWLCDNGHEWEAIIANRTVLGSTCPVCSGRKIVIGFNDLASTHPDLIKQWHVIKNGNLRPEGVSKGTREKLWWICEKAHEWMAYITDRTKSNPHGCPVCSGNKTLSGYNDLLSITPDIASEWHPTKNIHNDTSLVNNNSLQKAWWIGNCKHE
jgi:hypothetical protein